jgi:hypothetical protein
MLILTGPTIGASQIYPTDDPRRSTPPLSKTRTSDTLRQFRKVPAGQRTFSSLTTSRFTFLVIILPHRTLLYSPTNVHFLASRMELGM